MCPGARVPVREEAEEVDTDRDTSGCQVEGGKKKINKPQPTSAAISELTADPSVHHTSQSVLGQIYNCFSIERATTAVINSGRVTRENQPLSTAGEKAEFMGAAAAATEAGRKTGREQLEGIQLSRVVRPFFWGQLSPVETVIADARGAGCRGPKSPPTRELTAHQSFPKPAIFS